MTDKTTLIIKPNEVVRFQFDHSNYADLSIDTEGNLTVHNLCGKYPKIIDKSTSGITAEYIPEATKYYLGINHSNLQTVTIPPTDRPLKVGDVLVATSESMYLEIDKEYPIKSFNNGVIVIEAKSGYYLYFSSTEGAVYYYKNYFTLKP